MSQFQIDGTVSIDKEISVMKYFCLLFILFVVFLSCSPPESVEFPDPNLAAVVRKALDLAPDKPIRLKKLEKLEKLSAGEKGINDLTDWKK